MNPSIANIRRDYKLHALSESEVAADPFTQFTIWWEEAINSQIDEVNAMTLATATKEGMPSARIVLLKGYDERGFVFYTNYQSDKGETLAENPRAALVFFWKELERQVRIEGTVEKTSSEESDRYFDSRPTASRIGAWASPQSRTMESREQLEQKFLDLENQYASAPIPRPPHWGGYLVRPTRIEFWQGRSSRLHDRIQYSLSAGAQWTIQRLAP